MPGHHILEGLLILHETIHELHRKKWMGYFSNYISKRHTIKLCGTTGASHEKI
jgi:hypothetical protein